MEEKKRCAWLTQDPLYEKYHDEEWGVPQFDAKALFEMLLLEGLQAGLSWLTVLKKRERYRQVFHGFDPLAMAQMTEAELERCMQDTGLIRNRLKMKALVRNAAAYLKLEEESGGAVAFLWQFVGGKPLENNWRELGDVPAETEESRRMSKALKQRGFTFVGPTICYAFMQAVGMVNDHQTDCWRHPIVAEMKGRRRVK
ncbi:DNA-3-methyladenine glycosylase I [Azotosporobacter soli]|uniref:DNA-3-methyladenine glycosylase I n=1 Tax=Azotosporobacter soli TaxID=3055040 RepID=UPI0031FEA9F5